MIDGNKSQGVVSARRRLIRGTFAAPAVLALHSGSVLAASSNLRCVQGAAASPAPDPLGHTDAPDQYVRVQLYAQTGAASNVVSAWYLSGAVVHNVLFGYKKAYNAFLPSGQWRKVLLQIGGGAKLDTTVVYAQPAYTALGPKWVALRFNPQQKGGYVEIVGIIDGNSTGAAVTGSCWSSFVGL